MLEERYHEHMRQTSILYKQFVDAGISTQDARSILPMATHSPLTAEYNLRSLADLVGKRQNLRAQGEYADVVREMGRQVQEVHPWAKAFLYPSRVSTPTLDNMLKEALGDRTVAERPEVGKALKEVDLLKGTWG
jgi:thymidylate synthase ThyX